jgi:hypothetical protein
LQAAAAVAFMQAAAAVQAVIALLLVLPFRLVSQLPLAAAVQVIQELLATEQ